MLDGAQIEDPRGHHRGEHQESEEAHPHQRQARRAQQGGEERAQDPREERRQRRPAPSEAEEAAAPRRQAPRHGRRQGRHPPQPGRSPQEPPDEEAQRRRLSNFLHFPTRARADARALSRYAAVSSVRGCESFPSFGR